MHQGKDDGGGGDDADSEASSFSSNTFPLLSRSSMKRPFSLSSEREHQTPNIQDHFRCRGFRSRSKTVHADTFTRNAAQYAELLGNSCHLGLGSDHGHHQQQQQNRSPTIRGLFDSSGRGGRPTHGHATSSADRNADRQNHMVIPESILDEEMNVDDSEEESMDGQLSMLLDSAQQEIASHSRMESQQSNRGKSQHQQQQQLKSLQFDSMKHGHLNMTEKTAHHHQQRQHYQHHHQLLSSHSPSLGPSSHNSPVNSSLSSFMPVKSKFNLLGSSSASKSTATATTTDSASGRPKLAIAHATKPNYEVVTPATTSAKPPSQATSGQWESSSQKSSPATDNTTCLSPLAVPKPTAASSSSIFPSSSSSFSTSSSLDCKGSTLTASPAHIPTEAEKAQFQRSLDSATTLVFHRRTGLPLTSSPAPIRKCGTCFDFDSSLTSVNAIKKALFQNDTRDSVVSLPSRNSFSTPSTTSALLGNFEESVLNGRLEPASIVNGFTAEIGASGSFCPNHKTLPVTVFFYAFQDSDKGEKISSPYLGHINLGPKGYHVPRQGTVQVTLFNPNGTVVKMFVVRYNLSDMPPNSSTFLRQRTLFMPSDANEHHPENRKWLRYLIHLRFQSSKSGRIRLHTDLRILVFRKHDLDVATLNGGVPYELRSFVQMPSNPKYSKNIKSQ